MDLADKVCVLFTLMICVSKIIGEWKNFMIYAICEIKIILYNL